MMDFNAIPGYEYATILDCQRVEPQKQLDVYHGTAHVPPEQCHSNQGLPLKGNDIDLVRHVEPSDSKNASAFIGTVPFPVFPGADIGAASWAGEGGWVYHIKNWPGYNVNSLLDMKIPDGKGGFRGPLMSGEQETAIPARIPLSNISRIGMVKRKRGGLVVDFIWRSHG